jgi:hypothetical protein
VHQADKIVLNTDSINRSQSGVHQADKIVLNTDSIKRCASG